MNEFNICICNICIYVTKFIITNNFKKKYYKYIMYFLVIYL